MKKLKSFLESKPGLAEFLRYLVIGFSTTFINWGVNIALTELFALDATLSVIISWIASTICFAFWMYKFFVFRSRSMQANILWGEFAGFTGARFFTLGVETVITLIFCKWLGFDEILHFGFTRMVDGEAGAMFGFGIRERYIVKLFACVIVTILNYIFSKLIIFKKGQKLSQADEAEIDEGEKEGA